MRKMIKKIVSALLSILMVFTVSGCYDISEPEEITFVTAIGVDVGKEQPYMITFQGITTSKIKGGESGGGEEPIYNVAVEADSFHNAIELAGAFLADKLNFAQTKLLVFSKEIAEKELKNQIYSFARNIEIRSDAYVAVSKKGAYEFLDSVRPILTANPSKYYDMMFYNRDEQYVPKSNLNKVYRSLIARDRQSVIPLVAVNKSELNKEDHSEKEKNELSSSDEKNLMVSSDISERSNTSRNTAENYSAGNLQRAGENKSDILGGAVINSDGHMVGELNAEETKYYNMIEGGFHNSIFSTNSNKSENITVRLYSAKHPKYKVEIKDAKPYILVDLNYTIDYLSLIGDVKNDMDTDYIDECIKKNLVKEMKKILYKTSRDYQADVFGFYKHMKGKYIDYDKLKDLSWETLYPNAVFDVSIKITQKRSGLIIDSANKESDSVGR